MGCVLIVLCLLQAVQCLLLSFQHNIVWAVCLFALSETHDHIH